MIKESELTEIGKLFKPHGIKGELNAELDYDLTPDDLRCLILNIDGLFTPFFIESSRSKGSDRWLFKLEGIDDERQASALVNHEIYGLTAELPFDEDDSDGVHLYDLVGYTLYDRDKLVGEIRDIDDVTANVLMIVNDAKGKTLYVPFAEEFIMEIDPVAKKITMDIPDGVLDLN